MKISNVLGFLGLALTLAVAPVQAAHHEEAKAATIVDVAASVDTFSTLVAAVQAAGLVETLSGEGPFTVFAPTNEAFAALPAGTLDALLADPEQLAGILTLHVVSGKALAADVVGLTEVTTVAGKVLPISTVDGVSVGGVSVIQTDIMASNGVIHVIDAVILP